MAGFLPDALPPISISRTPIATNRRRASRYATPLDSPISTSSPITMLSRSQPRPSGSWSFRTEPLNHPDLPDFTSATLHASTPLSLHGRMSLALNSPERPSPTPVPQRTNSVPKTNPRLFNRGTSFRDSPSKDKRRKLVKKSLAQPTFEMLNPTQVRFDADEEVKAAQLDEQLTELVAELEREYASGEGDDATKDNAHMPGQDNEPARPRASYLKPNSPDGNHDPAKRWSHAPLLPELDFSPSDSESSLLFDPETHTPPPSAKIHISTMASMNIGTLDLKHTSSDPDKLTYRCDIYAENGASHRSIEEACQEVVANAGGQILDSYFYPGGFLYSLPPGIVEPLTTCELPMHEAKVEVHGWAAFPEARLDGLRMHPPEGQLGSERPLSVSTMTSGLKLRRDTGVDLVEAWTKSEGVAMIMDLPVPTEKSEEEPVIENKESENKTHNKASDVETPITTPITTPTRKPAIMKSLETLRRRAARSISSSSPPSIPLPFSAKKSPGSSSENRFTAVLDRSVGHSEGEGGSGSGAEDWESVRSEMQT